MCPIAHDMLQRAARVADASKSHCPQYKTCIFLWMVSALSRDSVRHSRLDPRQKTEASHHG
eukprot:526189-Amphidinium_carterae.1